MLEGRLVKYKLSATGIRKSEKIRLPETVKTKLDLFKEESYSSEGILQLDLGISRCGFSFCNASN